MKKKYIAPELITVRVNNRILAGSGENVSLPVNSTAQEGMDEWSAPQSIRNMWDDSPLYED